MARQFERKYRVRDGVTKLDERFLNSVFGDLDFRIDAYEQQRDEISERLTDLVRNGLTRIDEYLRPAYESIGDLAELGFLTATLLDDAPVTFALGTQTVLINEGPERDQFRPSPFLTFQVGDDYQKVGIALTTGYNREIGDLGVDFIALTPALAAAPGPHTGIYISSSAGSVVASILALADAKQARDRAADWAEKPAGQDVDGVGTRSAKAHAAAAAASAGASADSAGASADSAANAASARSAAIAARDAAAEHAENAALFDPANYFTRAQIEAGEVDIGGGEF